MKPFIVLFLLIVLGFAIGCDSDENPVQADNSNPVIEGLSVGAAEIRPDAATTFICYAVDPDDDELTYIWSAEAGSFPDGNNRSSVKWLAPLETDSYLVWVSVSDGQSSVQGSVNIDVSENGNIGEVEIPLGNLDITVTMVLIEPGMFEMGAELDSVEYADNDEYPRHSVSIDFFWIGKYEITQLQWEAVTDTNPSALSGSGNPVDNVSWEDVQAFIDTLNSVETGAPWRLPSEAEWEYVCRAGNDSSRFPWGDDSTYVEINKWAVFGAYNGVGSHAEVGSRLSNAWGINDMVGNVWEWCEDKYHRDYGNAPVDGSAWTSGITNYRVLRGGSWYDIPQHCRSAERNRAMKDLRYRTVGFRLARSGPPVGG